MRRSRRDQGLRGLAETGMVLTRPAGSKPVLVYDGDCGICLEWVRYWRALDGCRFVARQYQAAAADYPEIPREEFRRAIQLIEADGTVHSGAAATFRLYRGTGPYSCLHFLYSWLPGFARCSEWAYSFLSRHRDLLSMITHLLWGRNALPARFSLTSWVFLRLLGLIYLSAFVSFGVQAMGLIGSGGILPLQPFLNAVRSQLGNAAWYLLPNVFWVDAGDGMIRAVCIAGAVFSLLLLANRLTRTSLIILYVLYLSLVYAGQTFMSYQWDLLLVEAGFLANFLPSRSQVVPWMYRWLAFRFMFMGGMVKILSGDSAWRQFTALRYHFETQPLPTPAAWYANHLSAGVLSAGTAATLFIELFFPFLLFMPRRLRMFAACGFVTLQTLITVTGNYNFFNLLTLCICLFLFDDAALSQALPAQLVTRLSRDRLAPHRMGRIPVYLVAALLLVASTDNTLHVLVGQHDRGLSLPSRLIAPCQCANTYGPFAVMTRERNEIVLEGSMDGRDWETYDFRYKPGDPGQAPAWIIPHQPRLDWQMWFAALTRPSRIPWFQNLLVRLLEASPPVLALFDSVPFGGKPPLMVRASFYRYRFSTPGERQQTGDWWVRQKIGDYFPPVRLANRAGADP